MVDRTDFIRVMAPGGYKDDTYLIVQPGSEHTLLSLGLTDPLETPKLSVPTVVYKSNDNDDYSLSNVEGYNEIRPIIAGRIVDIKAFEFLLHTLIVTVLKEREEDEELTDLSIESVNLLIIQSSTRWSPLSIELLTKYAFENMNVHGFSIVPFELACMFAHGSIANSIVIDIGYEKSEILPIVDYQLYSPSKKVIDKGSLSINQTLSRLLPNLTAKQIEILKKSSIFECLSEEDAKKSFFGMEGLIENLPNTDDGEGNGNDEDGVLDIAAIVTSEKSTREILESNTNKLKNKQKNSLKPNSELETNTFYDFDGNQITVGKERFQGCNDLIEDLVLNIYHCLRKVPDLKKRQECYDNIIFTGQTSKIKGLKEKIMFHLFDNYVYLSDNKLLQPQAQFRNDIRPIDDASLTQVPRHLRLVPKVDYFSEWKKNGFEDCSFLGAQILSKQVFSQGNEFCLTKDSYEETGPTAIWSIRF